ncbi:MAG: TetR family transcriptional regulator [Acidimicrobiia bacterium]
MTELALASDGRVIGARAQRTRRRLLDATAKLLGERGALNLRVVDITREVGTSPATFYQYFSDVEEAILVLADEATDEVAEVEPLLERSWTDADGLANVDAFVEALMEYWEAHSVILRVRDLRAEEGDKRFWAVRQRGCWLTSPPSRPRSRRPRPRAASPRRSIHARLHPPPWRCSNVSSRTSRCSAGVVSRRMR